MIKTQYLQVPQVDKQYKPSFVMCFLLSFRSAALTGAGSFTHSFLTLSSFVCFSTEFGTKAGTSGFKSSSDLVRSGGGTVFGGRGRKLRGKGGGGKLWSGNTGATPVESGTVVSPGWCPKGWAGVDWVKGTELATTASGSGHLKGSSLVRTCKINTGS